MVNLKTVYNILGIGIDYRKKQDYVWPFIHMR